MIDTKDISVVVQGPIYEDATKECLLSIREFLPNAQIILSTWENSNIEGLDFDELVLSKDIGGSPLFIESDIQKPNNTARMILSAKAGLQKTSRKYTLRWRTDLKLLGNKFLSFFDTYQERNENWKILEKRVLCHSGTHPLWRQFHPTDITCFGLTSDVKNIWDIPLPSHEDSYYFLNNPSPETYRVPSGGNYVMRIGAEMYVWTSFLNKYQDKFGNIDFRHNWDKTKKNVFLTELTIANNLHILDRHNFDFEPLVHKYLLSDVGKITWMDNSLWQYYYKKHCVKKKNIFDLNYYILTPLKLLAYEFKYDPILAMMLRNLRKLRFRKVFRLYKSLSYRYKI